MVNTHKKGAEAENRVCTWFSVHGIPAERLRLAGTIDRGDLWIPSHENRLEVKNHINLLSAINEACHDVHKLTKNFPHEKSFGVVCRPGQPVDKWYLISTMQDYYRCGLDFNE